MQIEEVVASPSEAKKKKKETKSIFSSQTAICMVIAVFPDGTIVVLWTNPLVNSIHGHVHNRHFYGKETEGTLIHSALKRNKK